MAESSAQTAVHCLIRAMNGREQLGNEVAVGRDEDNKTDGRRGGNEPGYKVKKKLRSEIVVCTCVGASCRRWTISSLERRLF
jgi:hypothetical protein